MAGKGYARECNVRVCTQQECPDDSCTVHTRAADGDDATTFDRVTFQGCTSAVFGGAFIPEQQSSCVVRDSVFRDNSSPFGGAIDTGGTSTSVVTNTLFVNNTAKRGNVHARRGECYLTP